MIISVASGKGGTGKTTVSTNLAMALGADVQLLDCDVEAPNAHLFVKPDIREKSRVNAPIPKIDLEKCTYCKKCMEICRFGALAVLKNDVLVFENLCHSCGGCVLICPEGAVSEEERYIGEVEKGTVQYADFVHGRLSIGQVMVPPVIKAVRSHTRQDEVTIIDAPPGTTCPVIAAMNKADYVLLVTEPTPFGLHDLKLAVETVKVLGLPHGVVINRSGMGDDEVAKYCDGQNIPVLMEIPFDRRIAQAYSRGELLVDALPHFREKFQALFGQISSQVEKKGAKK